MNFKDLSMDKLIQYIKNQLTVLDKQAHDMKKGEDYYRGYHDIDNKQRLGIGEDGEPIELVNIPNAKIKDNQVAKVVDQKINYILSNPPKITNDEDKTSEEQLKEYMDSKFIRTLRKCMYDLYNCGIGWMNVSVDEDIKFTRMDPKEILPIWKDNNHESLSALIRKKTYQEFEDGEIKEKSEIEFYDDNSVKFFDYTDDALKFIKETAYIKEKKGDKQFKLGEIPFVYFKSPEEQPLLSKIKCLQDAINTMLSNFMDNMLEDPRNTILIIKNYDGEDVDRFRAMLAQVGVVKVKSSDGMQGGVETLQVEVNAENYRLIIDLLKKAIIDNAKGVDAKTDKSAQAPNEMNIQSMYTDIELDANKLEIEIQASFEYLQDLLRTLHKGVIKTVIDKVKNTITGKQEKISYATITFDRNVMVNESLIIDNLNKSDDLSTRTKLEKHPYCNNVDEELKRKEEELQESVKQQDEYDSNTPLFSNVGEEDVKEEA